MPQQKTFDVDVALDRAADVFSVKGYEAASMSDLTKGMGINKGSLYNAFGCKQALFIEVFRKFVRDKQSPLFGQLEAMDDPRKAISTMFDFMIAQGMADTDKKGDLIINTALELPNHDPEVQMLVREAVGKLEGFFRRMVDLGQERGDIPGDLDAESAAKSLVSMAVGIRVLSRGAFDAGGMLAIKNNVASLIRC